MANEPAKKKAIESNALPPALKVSIRRVSANKSKRSLFSWSVGFSLLLFLTAFLVYSPSLKSDFVYDARLEILEEGFITSLSNLPAVISLKVLHMNLMLADRPGQLLYLMLNAAIWGKNPFGYHLSSNILHAVNVVLLFVLLLRLAKTEIAVPANTSAFKVRLAAAAVALAFALHPIAVESVAEVSYSSCLLVTFFTLTTLLVATSLDPEATQPTTLIKNIGVFSIFAAVTCKESGITAWLTLIVYWLLFHRKKPCGAWLPLLGDSAVLTAAFLATRFLLALPDPFSPTYLGGSFYHVFLIQPRLWVFMMEKLFWPVHLSADYTLLDITTAAPSLPLSLIILSLVISLQCWLACKSRMGFLGMAIYWFGLAPVSNFIPMYRPLADRFYYLPLVGVAMQFMALLLMTMRLRQGFYVAMIPFLSAIVPLTLLAVAREDVFANSLSLWVDTARSSPSSYTAHNGLGSIFFGNGQLDDAIAQFRTAEKINPYDDTTHTNLGFALIQKGQVDQAIIQFQKNLLLNPFDVDSRYNLGTAFLLIGKFDQAIVQYQQVLKIMPNSALYHVSLGYAYFKNEQITEAIAQYQDALKIDPYFVRGYNYLGLAYVKKRQIDEAITQFRNASKIIFDPTKNHNDYDFPYFKKEQIAESINNYSDAVRIEEDYSDIYNNLGAALLEKGQMKEAIVVLETALRLRHGNVAAQNNLTKVKAALLSGVTRK